MKAQLNPKSLFKWLLNVMNEFENEKKQIMIADHVKQQFDEFCIKKISEISEFRLWKEHAKKQLQLFLLGKPSEFDVLKNYTE